MPSLSKDIKVNQVYQWSTFDRPCLRINKIVGSMIYWVYADNRDFTEYPQAMDNFLLQLNGNHVTQIETRDNNLPSNKNIQLPNNVALHSSLINNTNGSNKFYRIYSSYNNSDSTYEIHTQHGRVNTTCITKLYFKTKYYDTMQSELNKLRNSKTNKGYVLGNESNANPILVMQNPIKTINKKLGRPSKKDKEAKIKLQEKINKGSGRLSLIEID
jgi:predicted DNA-binding WGR domain protein